MFPGQSRTVTGLNEGHAPSTHHKRYLSVQTEPMPPAPQGWEFGSAEFSAESITILDGFTITKTVVGPAGLVPSDKVSVWLRSRALRKRRRRRPPPPLSVPPVSAPSPHQASGHSGALGLVGLET